MIKVKRLHPAAKLPTRSYRSAGYDLYASETTDSPAGKVTKVPTGIATEIPPSLRRFGLGSQRHGQEGPARSLGV